MSFSAQHRVVQYRTPTSSSPSNLLDVHPDCQISSGLKFNGADKCCSYDLKSVVWGWTCGTTSRGHSHIFWFDVVSGVIKHCAALATGVLNLSLKCNIFPGWLQSKHPYFLLFRGVGCSIRAVVRQDELFRLKWYLLLCQQFGRKKCEVCSGSLLDSILP